MPEDGYLVPVVLLFELVNHTSGITQKIRLRSGKSGSNLISLRKQYQKDKESEQVKPYEPDVIDSPPPCTEPELDDSQYSNTTEDSTFCAPACALECDMTTAPTNPGDSVFSSSILPKQQDNSVGTAYCHTDTTQFVCISDTPKVPYNQQNSENWPASYPSHTETEAAPHSDYLQEFGNIYALQSEHAPCTTNTTYPTASCLSPESLRCLPVVIRQACDIFCNLEIMPPLKMARWLVTVHAPSPLFMLALYEVVICVLFQ